MLKYFIILSSFLVSNIVAIETLQCPVADSTYTRCGLDIGYTSGGTYAAGYLKNSSSADYTKLLDPLHDASSDSPILIKNFFYEGGNRVGFTCPDLLQAGTTDKRKNVISIVTKINMTTGLYTCRYEDASSETSLKSCDYVNTACEADVKNIKNGITLTKHSGAEIAQFGKFPDYNSNNIFLADVLIRKYFKHSQSYSTSFMSSFTPLNYNKLGDTINQLNDTSFLDVYSIAQTYGLNTTDSEISSSDMFSKNISGVITGLITLDSNYFSGVDSEGRLTLATPLDDGLSANVSDAIKGAKGTYSHLLTKVSSSSGLHKDAKDALSGDKGNSSSQSLTSLMSQFDLKLWGFWVTLNSNLNKAYEALNTFAFFMATIWMIATLSIQKLLRSVTDTNDNTEYSLKAFGVAAGLLFFFVPISSSVNNVNMDITANANGAGDKATTINNLTSATFDDTTLFNSSYRQHMTIYKYFITYFAQQANVYATVTSNAVIVSYADYLVGRQNIFKNKIDLEKEVKDSYLQVLSAEKQYQFFKELCIPFYIQGFQQRQTFVLSNKELNKAMYLKINKVDDWPNASSGTGFANLNEFKSQTGIDIIHPDVCRKLEIGYKGSVRDALTSFHSIATKATEISKNVAIGTEVVIHNLFIMQKFMGWINTATMPVSYFLLKEANLFADSQKAPSLSARVDKSIEMADDKTTDYGEEDRLSTSAASVADSASQATGYMLSYATEASVYFMAPGFADLHKYIYDMLKNAMIDKDKKKEDLLDAASPMGFFKKIAMKFIPIPDVLTNIVVFTIATFSAIFLYLFMLSIIFMSIVSVMILFKIILYFIDLLKYFFISPFAVIWAVSVNRSYDRISAFIGQGAVLMFTPTLIVISATIFIFAYELMQMLAGMLIGTLISQLTTQYSLVNSTNSDLLSVGSLDYLKIYTLKESLELVVLLVSLFLAYKIIYDGPTWILSMFGYKEGETYGGQSAGQIAQKIDKTSNPVI